MSDGRKYMDTSKPGRLDANGVEWWATDPYPLWYRRDAKGEIVIRPKSDDEHWANEDEKKPELYSNCVILDFQAPITRAQLDRIVLVISTEADSRRLPRFRERPICGEREGNSVVPTIAADEC